MSAYDPLQTFDDCRYNGTMNLPLSSVRTLRRRDIWIGIVPLLSLLSLFAYFEDIDRGLLAGMSAAVISCVGLMYWDARQSPRFWATITAIILAHAAMVYFADENWIPNPTLALTIPFLIDFVAMAWFFPKLSGIRLDAE